MWGERATTVRYISVTYSLRSSNTEAGAPECYRENIYEANNPRKVSNTVDIWSFGCVLSVAAAWLLHGPRGVHLYRQCRELDTVHDTHFTDHGAFHHSHQVLGSVTRKHEEICEGVARFGDWLTPKVIDIITDMLHPDSDRPSANFLFYSRWQKILPASHRSSLGYDFPDSIHGSRSLRMPLVEESLAGPSRTQTAPAASNAVDACTPIASSHDQDTQPTSSDTTAASSLRQAPPGACQGTRTSDPPQRRVEEAPQTKPDLTSTRPPIPNLSISQAAKWRDEQRTQRKWFSRAKNKVPQLPVQVYANELEGRDIVCSRQVAPVVILLSDVRSSS